MEKAIALLIVAPVALVAWAFASIMEQICSPPTRPME